MFKNPSKYRLLDWTIKFAILALVATAIYFQIFRKENLAGMWVAFLRQLKDGEKIWFWLAVFLMPVNWAIESLKWQLLVSKFLKINFLRAYKAIFAGITISIFTPNRIGEYGGRILLVEPEYNWRAVLATLVGSFSQLAALLTSGIIGFLYFAWRFLEAEWYVLQGILLIGVALLGFMLYCFFNIDLVIPVARRIQFLHRFKKPLRHLTVLRNYRFRELATALTLSFLRYLTYSTQFFFLLKFFGVEASYLAALAGISTVYLVQTSIPLPPVMGLLARGQVALFVWSFFGGNEISILASTYGIFVINLAIPALLGVFVIVQTNVLKSFGYENDQNQNV